MCSWARSRFFTEPPDSARFTTETARRLAVTVHPRVVTDVKIENHIGEKHELLDQLDGIVVADFIYTRCPTMCYAMGNGFMQLQTAIREQGIAGDVTLLSISFDSERDTPDALAAYLRRHRADTALWQGVRVIDSGKERALLENFGVTVVADGFGGYVHNAAYYVVKDGVITRIFDQGEIESLLAYVSANPLQ